MCGLSLIMQVPVSFTLYYWAIAGSSLSGGGEWFRQKKWNWSSIELECFNNFRHEIGWDVTLLGNSTPSIPPKMVVSATDGLRLLLCVWPHYRKDPCRETKTFSLPFACPCVIVYNQVSPKEQGETSVRVGEERDGKSLFFWTSESVA